MGKIVKYVLLSKRNGMYLVGRNNDQTFFSTNIHDAQQFDQLDVAHFQAKFDSKNLFFVTGYEN